MLGLTRGTRGNELVLTHDIDGSTARQGSIGH